MADELIQTDDVSAEALKQLFEDAYMEVSLDSDGDVRIKDGYTCFLKPDTDKRLVVLYAIFGAKPEAELAAKLEYANRVNDQVKVVRTSVMADGRFYFDYYIPVEGGITKKAIVLATRRFLGTLESAMRQDTGDVVA